ncbi:hypothetical protein HLB44_00285 [Aquincola sp. S2]|uniref:Phage tail protein n=1 Tax=Pseudaquabacterium terrae TaxID=2732868 RepID=A0ABX2EC86_9BURK|nr:hypothetical protein [Aquabacterium terrae]NRF65410.1 hypothetical protein [Aquabacterium terrae]
MIERFFVKGARFNWAAPSAISTQPQDGSIVVSPPVTAPMFYVGLDDEVVDHSLPNVSTLGFRKDMGIPYTWLNYIHGRTAKVSTMGDVLTGFMSGCWITTWTDLNGRWVGHLGTIESVGKTQPPNSTVKNTFAQAMPLTVTGYNPALAFDAGDIMPLMAKMRGKPSGQVLSLVTAANDFYSILLLERMDERGIWICAGKKQMPPVAHGVMSLELITTRPRR